VAIKGENNNKEKTVEFGWAVEDLESKLLDPRIWIADTGATAHSTATPRLADSGSRRPAHRTRRRGLTPQAPQGEPPRGGGWAEPDPGALSGRCAPRSRAA